MSTPRYPAPLAWEGASLFLANIGYTCERVQVAGSLRRLSSAGSLDGDVKDVEVVAVPIFETREHQVDMFTTAEEEVNLLWERIESLQFEAWPGREKDPRLLAGEEWQEPYWPWVVRDKNGRLGVTWGDKYRKLAIPTPADTDLVKCDLFTTTWTSWGGQLVIRTGPAAFSHALVTRHGDRALCPLGIRFHEGQVWEQKGYAWEPIEVLEEEDVFELLGLPWLEPHERTEQAIIELQRGRAA